MKRLFSCIAILLASGPLFAAENLREEYQSEGIVDDLWKLSVKVPKGKLVLTTLIVTHKTTGGSEEGKETVKTFERAVYTLTNSYSELVRHTCEWLEGNQDGPAKCLNSVSGFGQLIEVRDLVRSGGGSGEMTMEKPAAGKYSSRVRFNFSKALGDSSESLEFRFRVSSLPISYFKGRLNGTGIDLPEQGESGWALTLPPVVDEKESQAGRD